MKNKSQLPLFDIPIEYKKVIDNKYTSKIKAPIYEPKNEKPSIFELMNNSKSLRLIRQIKDSNVSEDEKKFLIEAAKRHTIFDFHKIADYYAHASKEMQELMERSALVIIDFNKAIENGYIKLSDEIAEQYTNEHEEQNGK